MVTVEALGGLPKGIVVVLYHVLVHFGDLGKMCSHHSHTQPKHGIFNFYFTK